MTYSRSNNKLIEVLISISTSLLVYVIGLFVIPFVFFIIGIDNLTLAFLITLIITIISCLAIMGKYNISNISTIILPVVIVIFVIFCSVFISNKIIDFSWDGRTYHFFSQYAIKEGWNPIKDPMRYLYDFSIVSYPKSTSYSGAVLFYVFKDFEASKSINIILTLVSIIVWFICIYNITELSLIKSTVVSLAISLNPVVLYQIVTHYIDGQLYSIISILVATIILFFYTSNSLYISWLYMSIIFLVNIKTTALIYSIYTLLAGMISYFIIRYQSKLSIDITKCKHYLINSIIALFISIFIGINPYVYNLIYFGNPLFPFGSNLLGDHVLLPEIALSTNTNTVLWSEDTPINLRNQNRVSKFFVSVFAKSSISNGQTETKIPFTIDNNELDTFKFPDARTGGFGPLYGGIILISFLLMIGIFLKEKRGFLISLMYILILLLSIFPIDYDWNARYVPQAWLLPAIPILVIFTLKIQFRPIIFSTYVLLMLLLINAGMVGYISFSKNITDSNNVYSHVAEIKNNQETIVISRHSEEPNSNYFNLNLSDFLHKNGIEHYFVENENQLPCAPVNLILAHSIYSFSSCE